MKRTTKVWILVTAVFAVFFLLGLLLPLWPLDHLVGASRWILRGGFWLLGLIAALLLWFWRMPAARAAAELEPDAGADEIDVTLAAAKSRLAAAKGKSAARLGRIPVILVAGPGGSAKSTIITRSSLEPELLAGEVHRGDAVVPTPAINVWIAQDNLIIEAGGRLAGEAGRWTRLVRHIRPNRIRAMFPGGKQAPRAMVVCFGCDELLKPGASEAVPQAAQKLRARLAEVSQQLGIRLPVYVLFTKADRLPYFEDFVRNLTREEARDVLGVTLTVPAATSVGSYAERESGRLADAFRSLFRGLALRRLDVLPRETADDVRAGAYEFPREFRKISELATLFLLDLCRPSQLGLSPFLRGFYFTGVRAVFVHDAAATGPQPRTPMAAPASDATAVFDPRVLQQAASQTQAPAPGSRKIPEWVFHERVFHDVILRDETVKGVTAGGTRVNFLRRAAFATAAAACLVLATGFTWSFFANRGLLNRTRAAVDGARGLAFVPPLPDLPTLQVLDTLRVRSELLNGYSRGEPRPPLGLRWWLYSGNRVQPDVLATWLGRHRELLWNRSVQALSESLSALPAAPAATDEYGPTFDALKAYILMASHPTRGDTTTGTFLPPVLERFWTAGATLDTPRVQLAAAQFGFYSRELAIRNPYPDFVIDNSRVADTQSYLCGFAGSEQLYRMLLSQAAAASAPVRFTDAIVNNPVVVPAEFTKAGWEQAQAMLGNVEALFERESWVTGDACAVPPEQRAELQQTLRTRYNGDYVQQWTRFVQGGGVGRYSNIGDAARKLAVLATPQSPLLRMLRLASDNTAVDTAFIGKAFAPVHLVSPPEATTLSDEASTYLQGLSGLQAAVGQVSVSEGPMRNQAVLAASTGALTLTTQVSGLASAFSIEGEARQVGAAVTALLRSPITGVEPVMGSLAVGEVNAKGAPFCGPFDQLLANFPFNPRASAEATIEDLANVFKPGQGALWAFYDTDLQELLMRQGTRFVRRPGTSPEASTAFVNFFNQAARISQLLFDDSGVGPTVVFLLRPQTSPQIPEVSVSLDGQNGRFTQTQAAARTFEWTGSAASAASISAVIDGADVPVITIEPGPWATFRLFHRAASFERQGSGWLVTWQIPGRSATIAAELSFEKGQPIFQRDFMALGQCVRQIAR